MDVKLKREENKGFRLAPKLTRGEADFSQFIRLKFKLVVAVRVFGKKENLQVKLLTRDMEEKLKHTHTQNCRNYWSTTQKELRGYAALHCGQARNFVWPSSIVLKMEVGKNKSNCL